MADIRQCKSLDEVRTEIDALDRNIVALIAARAEYVKQAATFKKNTDDVKAPQRVEQVIAKVKQHAVDAGVDQNVLEATYRAMINSFIAEETKHFHKRLESEGYITMADA
ncbi:MAG: chorismate mutase [Fibrobacter sp.]|nr:chorismate mutase [Fibrobacter sp.]